MLGIESKQVDNTTNLLRLMMPKALAIGIILACTLLKNRLSCWQQSSFLNSASRPLAPALPADDLEPSAAP